MNKDTQEKIFDPFFTTKFTGRGLGMAAVLGIVRGHKGAIKIYSEIGQGTTCKVLFPALSHEASSAGSEHEEKRETWSGTGTILLVDDEDVVRDVGKDILERMGFDVLTAADGSEAVEVFTKRADDITCVILDLTMPHMNGEECFRELRRIRSDVSVIMSSGYGEQDVTQRFAGKGLAGFIQKPYRITALREKLCEVIDT